jgi:hypothetical protein
MQSGDRCRSTARRSTRGTSARFRAQWRTTQDRTRDPWIRTTVRARPRFVFRHLPLDDVHDHAGLGAEAAGAQGQFREMHDLLYAHQDALALEDLVAYSAQLGSTPADSATISRRDATPCASSSGTWRAPRRVGWPEHRRSS